MEKEELIKRCIEIYVEKVNESLDKHVRSLTYEEVLDPRYGLVESVKAIIEEVLKWKRKQ